MRILDRYILKSALNLFFGCLLIFFSLYIVIDIFSHLDEILKQKAGLYLLARYYLSYLPIIFVQVSPIACLLATLYTFGKMNHSNEVIAMRSSGLSIFQMAKTVIILGIILSFLVFWVNDRFVPRSLSITQNIKETMEKGSNKSKDKEPEVLNNIFMYGLRNRLYSISSFHPRTNTMEGISILEQDKRQNITKKIIANKGVYRDGLWRFYQSATYVFDENGQIKDEPVYYDEEIMAIPETPQDFLSQRQRTDFMTIRQIKDYMRRLSQSGATPVIRNLKVDLYQRFTSPFTNVIIILLGIPSALMIKKRGTAMASVGMAIAVGFLYYVLSAISLALGKAGILMPFLSASISHLIALTCALYLISKLR
jgi:lipopolysaccharide export system permease protein